MADMEHRCTRRLNVSLSMDIVRQGERIGRGCTRNICRDGMFLLIDPARLARNNVIELRMAGRDAEPALRALVVHLTPEGIGVCLLGDEQAWYEAIIDDVLAMRSKNILPKEPCGGLSVN